MDLVTTPAFDVCGALPTGTNILEASAGTGKTFTIAALTARYVATGTPLEELLLVTFGRAATSELRDRVRQRLVSAEAGLADALDGIALPASDTVLALLADAPPDEVRRRRANLARALADFDAATIETTHGFCHRVLHGLGVSGDVEPGITFVEDVTDLVDEVVHDLYLRKYAHRRPDLSLALARRIGREVVGRPDTAIEPAGEPADSIPGVRHRLATAVRAEVERRCRRRRLLTYDDLLTRLAATLADPVRGPSACARLRERYSVVMVDEFQDTDPTQWDIVRRAFGGGATTLVLIGDPKQAIYAFRGADVHAYLDAAGGAPTATLARNWRSDQGLLDAYDALFGTAELGHPDIRYRTVRAADANVTPGLAGAPATTPLRVRVVHRADGRVQTTAQKQLAEKSTTVLDIAGDIAGDIVELLTAEPRLVHGDPRPLDPADIAVLVATNREAEAMHAALRAAGVPAVIAGGSVFATPSAGEWLRLLQAIERPTHSTRVRAAALTTFLGWSPTRVALADDDAWEDVYVALHEWADVLRTRGVASLFELVARSQRLAARVLAGSDGERAMTDVRHVGELLHQVATTERLGVAALVTWLQRRIAEADVHDEERTRRLESDADAVQVLTIHRSKGLEFPVVYCPTLWAPWPVPRDPIPVYHDADHGGRRTIDVGGDEHPGHAAHAAIHLAEARGETMRLAYVALTRARHRAVVHWASGHDSEHSPLGRLLFGAGHAGTPSEDAVVERLHALAAAAPGCVGVERATGPRPVHWQPPARPAVDLAVRTFDRTLDGGWRRTSYTGLTAEAREPAVASEPEEPGTVDENLPTGPGSTADSAPVPLAGVPGGARVGTLLHGVLERTDFTAPDLAAELRQALVADPAAGDADAEAIVAGLALAIETPLGPLAAGRRLRDVAPADRLTELGFELPLAGGDAPAADVRVGALADLLAGHLDPHDPLAGYPDLLRDRRLDQPLRGYLTGSLDAVLRFHDGGTPRFAVVDYKSNRLAAEGEDLTVGHYHPDALAEAMQHAHYPLQALLYVVALHRFLRWRLAGYDPDTHLAGVLYLFLRGMVGPDTPLVDGAPCGVFAWRPPSALVVATSDLLDGLLR